MIIDSKLEFSDAQALTASASATTVSTNVVDLGTGKNAWGSAVTLDIGEGGELEFNLMVDTAIAVDSSGNVTVTLVSKAADASISSGATTHATLTLSDGDAAGSKQSIGVPSGTINRYVGVLYAAGSDAVTGGKVNAFLGLDHEKTD